jgi:hypothetical protein
MSDPTACRYERTEGIHGICRAFRGAAAVAGPPGALNGEARARTLALVVLLVVLGRSLAAVGLRVTEFGVKMSGSQTVHLQSPALPQERRGLGFRSRIADLH